MIVSPCHCLWPVWQVEILKVEWLLCWALLVRVSLFFPSNITLTGWCVQSLVLVVIKLCLCLSLSLTLCSLQTNCILSVCQYRLLCSRLTVQMFSARLLIAD